MASAAADEANRNFRRYLEEGIIRKEPDLNETAFRMYLANSDLSLRVAEELSASPLRPHLWVTVCSYYSMFYIANAVLLNLGYRTTGKLAHKATSDALFVLVLGKIRRQLLDEYKQTMEDALELAAARAEEVVGNYERERLKRARFQYEMGEEAKEEKAAESLRRAKEFSFEMKKML